MSIHDFVEELVQLDPDIAHEVNEAARGGNLENIGRDPGASLESIVLRVGRPVFDVIDSEAVLDVTEMASRVWTSRLAEASPRLLERIQSVGRIEVANHPRLDWVGTGWLIREDVVVTNRHVAELFGRFGDVEYVFRPGAGGPMKVCIDFLKEFGRTEHRKARVLRILHIEGDSGPDVAFLRVAPSGDEQLQAITLEESTPATQDHVAVVGYLARDPYFPDQDLMNRIFRGRYEKKRLAPGMITAATTGELLHDCSTLGGASGAAVLSLVTGNAVALHFAGKVFKRNYAVPSEVVGNRLDDVLASRVRRRRSPGPSSERITGAVEVSSRRTLTTTIPIRLQIEIDDPITAAEPVTNLEQGSPFLSRPHDVADDLLAISEARAEDFLDRRGFDIHFLGQGAITPLPILTRNTEDILEFELDGATRQVLHYRHFSVLMSTSRRLCRYSACNIDGATPKRRKRKGWRLDPRIREDQQILKECYGIPPKFSRGHMTRREDPIWGSDDDASTGNLDSMHVTNAVPQIQPFNAGIWLRLENYALDHTREDDMRVCVYTGPFLEEGDPIRFGVQIPRAFWKVIAFIHDETSSLSATGYIMSQASFIGVEEFVFGQHQTAQRPIGEIEARSGLSFGGLASADPLDHQSESAPAVLIDPQEIRFVR